MVNSLQTCVFGDRILGVLSSFFAHLSFLVSQALKKKMYFMGKKVVYELYSIEWFVGIPLWDAQRRQYVRWVATHLMERADKIKGAELRPYTMDEINDRLDKAEQDFNAGLGKTSEEVFKRLDENFHTELQASAV